jgi:hypothetical protein
MSQITRVLIEALPYIQKFKDKTIVIKYENPIFAELVIL